MKKRLLAWLVVLSMAVPFACAEEITDAAVETVQSSAVFEETRRI